jgi:hypothetical protein
MPHAEAPYLTSLPVNADALAATGPRTVVCFGLPRGGTSMIAGAALGLGVPMGEGLANNLEDPKFNVVTHEGTLADFVEEARNTIKLRDAAHEVWGFKCPFAPQFLPEIVQDLRGPRLVYIYRDPVPMALRARIPAAEYVDFVAKRLKAQLRHTAVIESLDVPCLMVSYENAMAHPEAFLDELAAFIGLSVPAHRAEIIAFLAPGSYKDPAPLMARLSGTPG